MYANAQQFKVYSVTGIVKVDGKNVCERQVLSDKTVITIGKGGKVVLFNKKDSKLITLKHEGKGTVSTLLKMSGNSEKVLSGSYLSFIVKKLTSEDGRDSSYMQSAGASYRDADSLLIDFVLLKDSVNNEIK